MTLRESIIPTKKPLAFTFSEIPREKVDVEIPWTIFNDHTVKLDGSLSSFVPEFVTGDCKFLVYEKSRKNDVNSNTYCSKRDNERNCG